MSVPKNKRTLSGVIYFDFAYDLVEEMTKYLLRDFGIKTTYRSLKVFTNRAKMSKEDSAALEEMCEKYRNISVETSYPEYILDYYRTDMLNTMSKLIADITNGYTIYPINVYELNLKKGIHI